MQFESIPFEFRNFLAVCLIAASSLLWSCESSDQRDPVPLDWTAERSETEESPSEDEPERREDPGSEDTTRQDADTPDDDASPARSPYVCDHDGGEVIHPESNQEFEKPPIEQNDGPKTRSDILRAFGGDLPESAAYTGTPERLHRQILGAQEELYANADEDIVLHFASILGVDDLGDSTLDLTVVVNYRPVQARFVHRSQDRSEILDETVGSGAEIPVDDEIELVDIEIDADQLPNGQVYDLGFGYGGTGDVSLHRTYRRFRVYQGGYDRPIHRCLEFKEDQPLNQREQEIVDGTGALRAGLVVPKSSPNWSPEDGPIAARPGETVTLQYAANTPSTDHPVAMAFVPLLDNEPLDWRTFFVAPENDLYSAATRGTFEVTLPTEPGIHHVRLGTWKDPFLLPADEPGHGIEIHGFPGRGTNTIRYDVRAE